MSPERPDLAPLAAWLEADTGGLEAEILRRLGEAPRPLPARTTLAMQAWAWPVSFAAALACVLAGLAASLERAAPGPASPAALLGRAADGEPPRAADVYMAMGRTLGGLEP